MSERKALIMEGSLVSLDLSSDDCSNIDLSLKSDANSSSTADVSLDLSLGSADSDDEDDRREAADCLGVDPCLCKPLYNGTNLSTRDSYLLIVKYALHHSLSKQAVSDLLNLVAMHLPKTSRYRSTR